MKSSGREVVVDLRNLRATQNDHFWPLFRDQHRYLVLRGGEGSGKSWFVASKIAMRLMTEVGQRFLLVRKELKTIRESVYGQLKMIVDAWGWDRHFRFYDSDFRVVSLLTGSDAVAAGMDDKDKIKSIVKVNNAWIEEADKLTEDQFVEVDRRMRAPSRTYKQLMISFNPVSIHSWLKKRFWDIEEEEHRAQIRTDVSTFLDNRFLPADERARIMRYKTNRPMDWRVYGEGAWGVTEGHVYPYVDMSGENWPATFDDEAYGLDWGFRNPTAVLWVGSKDLNYRTREGDLYWRGLIYKAELDTPSLARLMRQKNIPSHKPIYADSAEPARIKELRRFGFNVRPARKGKKSVKAGLDLCRSYTLHTQPDDVNLNAEFSSYVWAQRADGTYTDEPVKADDHYMDAGRGVVHTHFRNPRRRIGFVPG
jgi:phage terminase large subunit